MHQRLAVEISPLPQHEGAEREQAAERGQRLLHVVVVDRAGEAEIEAGDEKQHRHGRGELDQDRYAADNRRHRQRKMVEQAHHHAHIGKQRLEIGAGDVAEILEQHRAAADFLSAAPGARLAGIGRHRAVRLGRDHQHDVVVDHDLERTPAQAEPDRNVDGLRVVPAAEHANVAIVLDRCLDLHPHAGPLGKGTRDLVVHDLDEVGLRQDTDEFFAQAAIGRIEVLRGAAGLRIDLRVEVKIRLAQPIKLFEILVVKDGAEHTGKLPKPCLPGLVKAALGEKACDHVRLPQRNETIPLLSRGRSGPDFDRCSVHETVARRYLIAKA